MTEQEKEFTNDKHLDDVLEVIYDNYDKICTLVFIESTLKNERLKNDRRMLLAILRKLELDGFLHTGVSLPITVKEASTDKVTFYDKNPQYLITFDGVVFWEDEGYSGRTERDQAQKLKEAHRNSRIDLMTFAVAVGGFGLFLLELVKYFENHPQWVHACPWF